MKQIRYNNKVISEASKPFIIAEIGVNYYDIATKENIDLIDAAKLMIKEAADSGADSVKFQTYKAEKLASKCSPAYWDTNKESTTSQYELFKKYDKFGEEEYKELTEYAKEKNCIFLSTPFDIDAVDYLNEFIPFFKISSSDITNIPFIKYISRTQKPIFISTGASTVDEINNAVNAIVEEGNNQIVIMHCILNYPTSYEEANLGMIKHIRQLYPHYLVGYSDHTPPDANMMVLTTAALLGATVIEKHFTLDKNLPGNDHYHSMDPSDLKLFMDKLDFLKSILGSGKKEPLRSEIPSIKYARRSLVARRYIPKGKIIEEQDLTWKRPGTGISPALFENVIGSIALENINYDEILTFDKVLVKKGYI